MTREAEAPNPHAKTGEEIALGITRIFDAPRSLVFRVWSTPEHLARWWGPRDFTVPSIRSDFRKDGQWRSCMRSPEGVEYWASGVYREIVLQSRLVFTFQWEEDGAIETLVTVTFEDAGTGTRLTFRQAPFRTIDDRDSHAQGWSECLDRLGNHLNRQNGSGR